MPFPDLLALAIEGAGDSVLALTQTLNGSATMTATQGALVGLNVEQLLRRLELRPLDLVEDVIFKGATVQGIYGRRMYETWVQMTALLKAGRVNLQPLFGERLELENFEAAFAKLQSGLAGKILMYPNGIRK